MLGAVVSGLADLTSGAFGYQNNATTNAGLAANAMYNVATCGGGGSSGGSGGSAADWRYRYWDRKIEFNGKQVYQRDDIIDPHMVDPNGRTNLQRMKAGTAPLGPDGLSINLHHLLQTDDSPIAEVTKTFHQENSGIIHINPNSIPSGINRPVFDAWRRQYWMQRARDFQ